MKKKKYYNFKSYIDDEDNKYKISIIYTFHNIANLIEGINEEDNNKMSFMISEIKSEKQLDNIINEIKTRNESNKSNKKNIVIHFEQFYSKQIQFISNFIFKNFKDDKYNYIFIMHIKRNFDNIKDRIYSIPDINPDINQLFIDNLNAPDINLNDLLNKSIKEIMESNDVLMDFDREFKMTSAGFKYKESINNDQDLEGDCKSLLDKIFTNNYIDKNSIDIISCLLEYIKELIVKKDNA